MARKKQRHLEGMEPEVIPELEAAADLYYDAKTERVQKSAEEKEAKQNLIDKMHKNGLELYTTADGIKVTLLSTSNVKAKKSADPEEEEGEE